MGYRESLKVPIDRVLNAKGALYQPWTKPQVTELKDYRMEDFSEIVISCDNKERIIGAVDRVLPQLPKEVRDKLANIKGSMIQHIGKEGMFVCLNGKSVASIIKEYGHVFKLQISTAGEIDGTRFQLSEAPKTKITIDEFGRPTGGAD